MNDQPAPCVIAMSVEIEIPSILDDELQDVIADDLSNDLNVEHLAALIKKWARTIAGVSCHVAIDVE